MECRPHEIACRLDEIVTLLASGPSTIEVWSFVVAALGTLASSAIALVAIILSVRATTESRRQEREIREAEARRRRAELAHDMAMWFSDGVVFMLADLPMTEQEIAWSDRGESIMFRARTFEHSGANELMQAAKEARGLIVKKPLERRLDAAIHVARLFKFVTSEWVEDPESMRGVNPEAWVDDSWFEEPPTDEPNATGSSLA